MDKKIDTLLDEAMELSKKQGFVSVSYIQRVMRIGYTRASRLVDEMIEKGFCEEEYAEGKGHRALCQTQKIKNDFQKLADRFIEEGAWDGVTITALRLFSRWLEEGDFSDPTPADDSARFHGHQEGTAV